MNITAEQPKNVSTSLDVTTFYQGIKETDNKLTYELDWRFIEEMAKRMAKNKNKYPKDNWKKPIEKDLLLQAIARHHTEIQCKEFVDDGNEYGHLIALAVDAMMLYYQLKNYKENDRTS